MAGEPQERRKLAAIMFTDMVGYSALTQKNEALALELLKEHRELLRPMFPKHGGKEVDTKGDAFFVEFASTLEAARCAIAIQKALFGRNGKVPLEKQIRLRIGLHVGDVVHMGKYVHGDGVNIAARLEPLATPGGICLSEDVARQIQNKIDLPLRKLGRGELRNIQLPVEIYKILLPWEKQQLAFFDQLYFRFKQKRSHRWSWAMGIVVSVALLIGFFFRFFAPSEKWPMSDSRPKIRLAVLPFDNITKNPEDEYFADGMTDEMISKLSKISGFGVIARTSVMQYKTAPKSIADIGQELNVSKVLEGSVRKAAEKLRIAVKLIDVQTQEPVWSTEYDKEFADVFAVQSEVAQQVASALRVELSPSEKRQIEKRGTESLEAYNLYLQGMYYVNKLTLQGLQQGVEYLNAALKIDPDFALAYAGLAIAYYTFGNSAFLPAIEVYPKAKSFAVRALEIDPTLVEAQAKLADLQYRFDWDWQAAENNFNKILEKSPPSHLPHQYYAAFLSAVGQHDQALAESRQAQALDPLFVQSRAGEGIILYFARRYDEAIKQFNKTITMDPNYPLPYVWLALSYIEKGMAEEALSAAEKYVTLTAGGGLAVAVRGYIYARAGRRNEALKTAEQLVKYSKQRYVPATVVALIYAGLGETDLALEWIEKAYQQRDPQMFRIKVMPPLDPLRSDPRFTALLKKIGLEK